MPNLKEYRNLIVRYHMIPTSELMEYRRITNNKRRFLIFY